MSSLFGQGEGGERVVVWDDGGADHLEEEREAWYTLNVSFCRSIDEFGRCDNVHPEERAGAKF